MADKAFTKCNKGMTNAIRLEVTSAYREKKSEMLSSKYTVPVT